MENNVRINRLIDYLVDRGYTVSGRDLAMLNDYDDYNKSLVQNGELSHVRICCNVDCNDETTEKSPYCEFHASM